MRERGAAGRFIVNRIVRPRMACSGCDCFTQAPLPSIARQAIAKQSAERGGRSSAGDPVRACWPMCPLSAMQASPAGQRVNKYADHLPLYRQSQIFDREGLDLDRSTLADWVGKSTALLEPLAEAIGRHVLAGGAIFVDDTPVAMLAPGNGKTQTARLWAYGRDERPWGGGIPPASLAMGLEPVAHKGSISALVRPQRAAPKGSSVGIHWLDARPLSWILGKPLPAAWQAGLHAETGATHGYAGFEDLYRTGEIREVACLAHVRRKFVPSRQIASQSPAGQRRSTRPKARPSPTRPSGGLLGFAPSRRRHEGCHRINGSRSGRLRPNPPSTAWRLG